MQDFVKQLDACFSGRVCVMGIGNTDFGDDGLGMHLAQSLQQRMIEEGSASSIILAGTTPERFIDSALDYDHLIFLDAVQFGGSAGSVVLLTAEEMAARFPQISTHKISLGLLAMLAEKNGRTKAWLLGVQPETLKQGSEISPAVQATLPVLEEILGDALIDKGIPYSHEAELAEVSA
ncbi:MAG: hydrogenase maturation protease [Nitrospirota bacterium]